MEPTASALDFATPNEYRKKGLTRYVPVGTYWVERPHLGLKKKPINPNRIVLQKGTNYGRFRYHQTNEPLRRGGRHAGDPILLD